MGWGGDVIELIEIWDRGFKFVWLGGGWFVFVHGCEILKEGGFGGLLWDILT